MFPVRSITAKRLIISGYAPWTQNVNILKQIFYISVGVCILLTGVMIMSASAAPLPGGDTQVALIDEYKIKIGLQYRVMWNSSNIPLSGVTSTTETKNYDFFRQRMRFNIDIQPTKKVGGFMQLEYRGGWGGSSPENDDPRDAGGAGDVGDAGLSLNAFNRLKARGVRYGYIYYTPVEETYLAAGIIPVSDRIGDVLFSADWDFNVGGISFNSVAGRADYRLAYVRIIDGAASSDKAVIGNNGDLFITDINYPVAEIAKMGLHIYYLHASKDIALEAGLPGKVSLGWYSLSGSVNLEPINLNGFVCLNKGTYGDNDNSGWAIKTEAAIPLGSPTLKIMGVYSTGDKENKSPKDQFRTIQGIFGTEGFWAYSHIFTSSPPSDVNDFGVGLDNEGRGLMSLQAKYETPLIEKLGGEIFAGWFQASAGNSDGNKDMGTEIGGMLTYEMAKHLNLQFGAAFAFLGDYYKINTDNPDNILEVFSRFQLQF